MEEKVRDVDELLALFGDRILYCGMAIAQRIHADATQQIEVAVAVLVDKMDSLTANKENRIPLIGCKQQPRFGCLNCIQLHSDSPMQPSLRCHARRACCTDRVARPLPLQAG